VIREAKKVYFKHLTEISRDKWAHHNGMACPQVADKGTAPNMEGSCEYIE
jgi:hypothetical protein